MYIIFQRYIYIYFWKHRSSKPRPIDKHFAQQLFPKKGHPNWLRECCSLNVAQSPNMPKKMMRSKIGWAFTSGIRENPKPNITSSCCIRVTFH